ncbi:MAG: hypothetical protein ABJZ55_03810 [Fuerstiella sp.]
MKRTSFCSRIFPLHFAVALILMSSTGCLSMPHFTQRIPAVAVQDAGPPIWDLQPTADAILDRHAVVESASGDPEKKRSEGRRSALDRPADRIASAGVAPRFVREPNKFKWTTAAKSAGDRDIQTVVIGKHGYRTLLIGSIVGNDDLALKIADRLARHVQENQIVLGGVQLSVIRNLNPDGEAADESETAHGIYLNRQFPQSINQAVNESALPTEIQFLLRELRDLQPQRVIHLRTIGREQGVVACSSGANDVAKDLSTWLGFELMDLPGRSVTGTLERFLSESQQCDIVTFAMPEQTAVDEAWDLYSDALLNLLMDEDFATRKMAREKKASKAADRRSRND